MYCAQFMTYPVTRMLFNSDLVVEEALSVRSADSEGAFSRGYSLNGRAIVHMTQNIMHIYPIYNTDHDSSNAMEVSGGKAYTVDKLMYVH